MDRSSPALRLATLAAVVILADHAGAQRPAPPVTDASLRKATPAEWLSYGRDYAETHYSPLARITTANVQALRPVWSADLGTTGPLEATPVVSNGVLYATGAWSTVFAFDARTGMEKWRWDPQI